MDINSRTLPHISEDVYINSRCYATPTGVPMYGRYSVRVNEFSDMIELSPVQSDKHEHTLTQPTEPGVGHSCI